MTRPSAALRLEVARRARDRCEYCLIHQPDAASRHQVDHVISEKHGGLTVLENLALSCTLCNRRKASDIAAHDPETGQLVALFNPRLQAWSENFRRHGPYLAGLTAEGRATVEFLRLNAPERILERDEAIRAARQSKSEP